MKSLIEINKARSVLCDRIQEPGLIQVQYILLQGMLNALIWAADGENKDTMERVLAGERFKTEQVI